MSKGQRRRRQAWREVARWGLALVLALGWSALLGGWLEPRPRPPAPGATLGLVRVAPPPAATEATAAGRHDGAAAAAPGAAAHPVPQPPHHIAATAASGPARHEPRADLEPVAVPFRAHTLAEDGGAAPPPQTAARLAAARLTPGHSQLGAPPQKGTPQHGKGLNGSGAAGPREAIPPNTPEAPPRIAADPVDAARLDAGFRLLAPVRPPYPERARLHGRGGKVRVELAVGRDGAVERVRVLDETGRWGFGRAVRQAYAEARFSPPTVQGRPVRVLWRQTVIFKP